MSGSNDWITSSHSNGDNCVQVSLREEILVRDSKDPTGPVLRFTAREWTAFLAGVRHGEFDLRRPWAAATDSSR